MIFQTAPRCETGSEGEKAVLPAITDRKRIRTYKDTPVERYLVEEILPAGLLRTFPKSAQHLEAVRHTLRISPGQIPGKTGRFRRMVYPNDYRKFL